jgi:hypothetical protein
VVSGTHWPLVAYPLWLRGLPVYLLPPFVHEYTKPKAAPSVTLCPMVCCVLQLCCRWENFWTWAARQRQHLECLLSSVSGSYGSAWHLICTNFLLFCFLVVSTCYSRKAKVWLMIVFSEVMFYKVIANTKWVSAAALLPWALQGGFLSSVQCSH